MTSAVRWFGRRSRREQARAEERARCAEAAARRRLESDKARTPKVESAADRLADWFREAISGGAE